jgi:hypothetical protein
MVRQQRIEYAGSFYQVMNRARQGDRAAELARVVHRAGMSPYSFLRVGEVAVLLERGKGCRFTNDFTNGFRLRRSAAIVRGERSRRGP